MVIGLWLSCKARCLDFLQGGELGTGSCCDKDDLIFYGMLLTVSITCAQVSVASIFSYMVIHMFYHMFAGKQDGVWRPPTRKILFMLRLVTLHLLVLAAALSLWMLLAISMKHLVLQSLMAVQSLHFARFFSSHRIYCQIDPFSLPKTFFCVLINCITACFDHYLVFRCLEESNDYGFRTPFHSLKPLWS